MSNQKTDSGIAKYREEGGGKQPEGYPDIKAARDTGTPGSEEDQYSADPKQEADGIE